MAKPIQEAISTFVAIYPEYVRRLLARLRMQDIPENDIKVLNQYLHVNCRLLHEDEYRIERVDENLKNEVVQLEAELASQNMELKRKRESYPVLQRRIRQAVMVDISEAAQEPNKEANANQESELNPALLRDIQRWQGGVLSRRTESVTASLASTRAQAARLQKAVDTQQMAIARGEAAESTPHPTIIVAPPGTPETRAREAFSKRGLELPIASPNVDVTPRSRRARRKL